MNRFLKQIEIWVSKPTHNFFAQLIRYLFSGGIAFIVDKLVFLIMRYNLDLGKYLSTSIAFAIGLVITYTLSVVWIFSEHRLKSRLAELGIFILIGMVGMALMNLFMWIFSSVVGISHDFISNILSTICVTLWNFIAKKYILFTKKKGQKRTYESK